MPSCAAVHLSLPFIRSKDSAHLFYKICEAQIHICDNVLGYVIVLTLVNKRTQTTGLKKKKPQRFKHHAYSTVAFVIASVISIVHKLYMYLRKHCCNTPRPRIEPNVLGKILPPPELSNQGNTVNIRINTSNDSLAVTPEAIPLQGNPQVMTENPKQCKALCSQIILLHSKTECEPT